MRLRLSILVVTIALTALVAGWFGLWLFFPVGRWWMEVLNRFTLWLAIPAALLGLAAAWQRQRWAVALAGVSLAILIGPYWPYWWPRLPAQTSGLPLRVMTFNVLYSNTQAAAVAEQIRRFQPDVVALQEVKPELWSALQEQLRAEYPYGERGVWQGFDHPYGTTAVLSRSPLEATRVVWLSEDRPVVITRLTVRGQPLTFAALHLVAYGPQSVPWREARTELQRRMDIQAWQVKLLLEEIERIDGALIIGCDCNTVAMSDAYRTLSRVLSDAGRESG